MALSSASVSGRRPESAPAWIFPLYIGGLLLVFIGERVLAGLPKGAPVVSALGVVASVAATVLRFAPRFRSGGERRNIEVLLAVLSLLGLLGLAIYFATVPFAGRFGLEQLATEKRARVEEFSRVLWLGLLAISVLPMSFAETALLPMRRAERPESRRARSAATAGLTLALAGLYCALGVYAAGGVETKLDYSYNKTSKPSESTRKLAQSLTGDPIRVVAFFPEVNEVRREAESYLKEATAGASKLKVEFKDRLLHPKLAQELRASQDGVIVLSRGSVTQQLQLGTELEQARSKLKTLDKDFQEQLLKIARSKHVAYLTVGHGEVNDGARGQAGERSAQIVRTLLQKQNYTVKDLGLGQGLANDVPGDADVVIVLGPTSPFSTEELASLRRYAGRAGKLVLALDPEAQATQELVRAARPAPGASSAPSAAPAPSAVPAANDPGAGSDASAANATAGQDQTRAELNGALAEVAGLKFGSAVLANEKQHVRVRYNDSDRTRLMSNSFSSHASVSTLSRNAPRAAVVVFGAGSLEKAAGKERIDFAVRSLPGTFQDANHNFSEDKPAEKSAVWNLAAAVSRPVDGEAAEKKPEAKKDEKDEKKADKARKDEPKEFRAFVLADADAFTDIVMGEVVGNQVLFVDAVRWLVGEESVQGLPNTEEDVKIEHTKQADLAWFYASIFGVPGVVLAAGLFIGRRSRKTGGKR